MIVEHAPEPLLSNWTLAMIGFVVWIWVGVLWRWDWRGDRLR